MTTDQIITKLLTAQQALAEVRVHIPNGEDSAEIGFMLYKIPAIIGRIG